MLCVSEEKKLAGCLSPGNSSGVAREAFSSRQQGMQITWLFFFFFLG